MPTIKTILRPILLLWHRSTVPGVVPEAPLADYDVDWKRLSVEFRQLLLEGALEPAEVHAKYHREFKKVCPRPVGAIARHTKGILCRDEVIYCAGLIFHAFLRWC